MNDEFGLLLLLGLEGHTVASFVGSLLPSLVSLAFCSHSLDGDIFFVFRGVVSFNPLSHINILVLTSHCILYDIIHFSTLFPQSIVYS